APVRLDEPGERLPVAGLGGGDPLRLQQGGRLCAIGRLHPHAFPPPSALLNTPAAVSLAARRLTIVTQAALPRQRAGPRRTGGGRIACGRSGPRPPSGVRGASRAPP